MCKAWTLAWAAVILPGQLQERISEPRNLYILELSFFFFLALCWLLAIPFDDSSTVHD